MGIREQILSKMQNAYGNLGDQIERLEAEKELQTIEKNEQQAQGDLRENAGYHAAMEAIQRMEMQLKKLNSQRDTWEDFKKKWSTTKPGTKMVQVGSLVKIKMIEGPSEKEWQLLVVPDLLGNASISALSITSKVGNAILGKELGNSISIKSNRYGTITYKIISIE